MDLFDNTVDFFDAIKRFVDVKLHRRRKRRCRSQGAGMNPRPFFFAPLVTHRKPFEDVQSAFELNERYADGIGKLVLEF